MFGSVVLDVALGVVFVFLLVSLICSALREAIEARLKSRSLHLQRGIVEMLQPVLARRLYEHPLVGSLYEGGYAEPAGEGARLVSLRWIVATIDSWRPSSTSTRLPSYIPARNFALALLDLAGRGNVAAAADAASAGGAPPAAPAAASPVPAPLSIESIRASVAQLQNPGVERAVLTAIDTANGQVETAIANVQKWYDASMDRVSGWYKRETQHILFWLGLAIAVSLNIDTVALVRHLSADKDARASLVQAAVVAADDDAIRAGASRAAASASSVAATAPAFALPAASGPALAPAVDPAERLKALHARLESLNVPLGWNAGPLEFTAIVYAIPGWLLTAFAITFGAPFWFDVLNKLMVIRSTVKPHEKSGEEGSQDRRDPPKSGK